MIVSYKNSWKKGIKNSEESNKRRSETVKKLWENPEYREKQSKSKPNQIKNLKKTLDENPEIRKIMSDKKIGKDSWNKGKIGVYSQETIKQISDSVKKLRENPEYREYHDKLLKEGRKKNRRISSIEKMFAKELIKRNIDFSQQAFMLDKYAVDFLINDDIVIECDGDYWHNLPNIKEKDKIKDKILIENGFTIFRFWEHEIKKSVSNCVDKIIPSL